MTLALRRLAPCAFMLLGFVAVPLKCQDIPGEVKDKLDAAVADAYHSAAAEFPCRVKTRGKADMLRWEDVDRCLNQAAAKVDWDGLAARFKELKASAYPVSDAAFASAVEASLSAHALAYDKVFTVKSVKARLPLTNSVLKFLPADSLQNLPVFDKTGVEVGTFSGVFIYERGGSLVAANPYKLALFQYTDRNGNVQSASDKLLLDSFGVPWKDAMNQPGYRLTSDKLLTKH